MYEIKNSKQVKLYDKVRFRCIRCGVCCRNVEGSVVIEPKDGYYLAKHLGITVSEFYEKYAKMFLLEDVEFPIFTLNTVGKDNSCIFLKGKRCSVQTAKPRTCKMYPFWIHPDDNGGFVYNLSTEQTHHPKGSLIRVKDWMKDNLSEEDKEFLLADAEVMTEIASIYMPIRKLIKDDAQLIKKVIFYRHIFYETDRPFMAQYLLNNKLLKEELQNMLNSLKTEVKIMNKQSFKGFYRFTDFEHLQYNGNRENLKEQFNIVQQVPDEGVEYEFMISFYRLGNKLSARAEIFDDAFVAFEMHSDLFFELSKYRKVTPDQIEKILISLGYRNLTKEEGESNGK